MKKDTIVRTAVLILALFNQCLSVLGRPLIPVAEENLGELISLGFTVAASLVAWWKNNSVTPEAVEADKYLAELKNKC